VLSTSRVRSIITAMLHGTMDYGIRPVKESDQTSVVDKIKRYWFIAEEELSTTW
jgi:hypothetical protein